MRHLPWDLYKDKKWVGIALYVVFTVPPTGKDFVCRCHLSTSTGALLHLVTLCPNQDNFVGSRRLCFIHIPRARFTEQWNQCRYIAARFEVSARFEEFTPGVEVDMCGMRLVYAQDLNGLIQTITHCTIRNPPVYFSRDNKTLVSQWGQPFLAINMTTNLLQLAKRFISYPKYVLINFIPENVSQLYAFF